MSFFKLLILHVYVLQNFLVHSPSENGNGNLIVEMRDENDVWNSVQRDSVVFVFFFFFEWSLTAVIL